MKEEQKRKIMYIGIIIGLILLVTGISYAMYTFTGTGTKENIITTGQITVSFEEKNNILIKNRYPETDTVGLASTDSNSMMEFTVSSDIVGEATINYAIGLTSITEGTTLKQDYIKIYLTKNGSVANGFTENIGRTVKSFETSKIEGYIDSHVITQGSVTGTQTDTYTLKAWIDENYNLPTNNTGNNNAHSNQTVSETFSFKIKVIGTDEALINNTNLILEGDGQVYNSLAPSTLSFRSTAPLDEFQEVKVNGETVDPSNYNLTEGSTIVTLSIDYLSTLPKDNYTIEVVSESGSPDAGFSVVIPEVNDDGFYYNQPYVAYVDMYGENEAFFIRDDNTIDIIGVPSGSVQTGTYEVNGNILTVNCSMGTLTGTISEDGNSIYCNELAVNFVLNNELIAADGDYIYFYDESLGGYVVNAVIDKTKLTYPHILMGINGKSTIGLGNRAFQYCANLTSIAIPNGITIIGKNAFFGCEKLLSIVIPSSVTSIGTQAFFNCNSLSSIEIPNSIISIGDKAFSDCRSLTNINYNGTKNEWNTNISFGNSWNSYTGNYTVHCADGDISKN